VSTCKHVAPRSSSSGAHHTRHTGSSAFQGSSLPPIVPPIPLFSLPQHRFSWSHPDDPNVRQTLLGSCRPRFSGNCGMDHPRPRKCVLLPTGKVKEAFPISNSLVHPQIYAHHTAAGHTIDKVSFCVLLLASSSLHFLGQNRTGQTWGQSILYSRMILRLISIILFRLFIVLFQLWNKLTIT
jgi:hypothetical protein